MQPATRRILTGVASALLGIGVSAASAGDGNDIRLLQDSSGAAGNTISIDQSGAWGSLVAGDPFGLTPATQRGAGNVADLTLSGDGALAILGQDNFLGGGSVGNTATMTVTGLGQGSVVQFGDTNTATLAVTGLGGALDEARGLISQIGSGNDATLTVNGAGASGTLIQIGRDNTNSLTVTGNGTTATYTQIGSNLSNQDGGVSVVSNGGAVHITQTSFF